MTPESEEAPPIGLHDNGGSAASLQGHLTVEPATGEAGRDSDPEGEGAGRSTGEAAGGSTEATPVYGEGESGAMAAASTAGQAEASGGPTVSIPENVHGEAPDREFPEFDMGAEGDGASAGPELRADSAPVSEEDGDLAPGTAPAESASAEEPTVDDVHASAEPEPATSALDGLPPEPQSLDGQAEETRSAAAVRGQEPASDEDAGPEEDAEGAPGDFAGGRAAGESDIVSQDFDRTWQRIEEAFNGKRTLSALVVDRVKGGLVVDIGMQGFVPASQVGPGKSHDLDRYVGRTLKLRITDLDRERQRVVLSARQVQEEEHARRKRETMGKLKVGLITEGVVRRLTDFGAFVDIGGVDGLLHVSEMSWSRVTHPREAVSPGDHIKVKVLKISDDRKKISLGMRQLLPDPWNSVDQQFKVGTVVSGKVVRAAQFGCFVQVKDGVEAILPNSEISGRKPRAEDLPQVGDTIQVKVIELRPEDRRMTLSIRRIQEDQERRDYQEHVQTQTSSRRTTIGDMFGDILSDWQGERDDSDPKE